MRRKPARATLAPVEAGEPPATVDHRRQAAEAREAAQSVRQQAQAEVDRIVAAAKAETERLEAEARELDELAEQGEAHAYRAGEVVRLRGELAEALARHDELMDDLASAEQASEHYQANLHAAELGISTADAALRSAVAEGAGVVELARLTSERAAAASVPPLVRQQFEAAAQAAASLRAELEEVDRRVRSQWGQLEAVDGAAGIERPVDVVGPEPPPPILSREAFEAMLGETEPAWKEIFSPAQLGEMYRTALLVRYAQQAGADVGRGMVDR